MQPFSGGNGNNSSKTQVSRVVITPGFAAKLLALNTNNRPVRNARLKKLTGVIKNGQWTFNYATVVLSKANVPGLRDGIVLDKDTEICGEGVLMDGQHRLMACVNANISIETLLVCDLSPEACVMATIDNTDPRDGADHLALRGENNAHVLASAIKIIINVERGFAIATKFSWTNGEIEDALEKHPSVRASVARFCGRNNGSLLLPPSILSAFHYLFSAYDPELADSFMNRLVHGIELEPDSPVLLLRDRFIANRVSAKEKLTRNHVAALLVKTWNYERTGKTVKTLRYRDNGPNPEPFPVIR